MMNPPSSRWFKRDGGRARSRSERLRARYEFADRGRELWLGLATALWQFFCMAVVLVFAAGFFIVGAITDTNSSLVASQILLLVGVIWFVALACWLCVRWLRLERYA